MLSSCLTGLHNMRGDPMSCQNRFTPLLRLGGWLLGWGGQRWNLRKITHNHNISDQTNILRDCFNCSTIFFWTNHSNPTCDPQPFQTAVRVNAVKNVELLLRFFVSSVRSSSVHHGLTLIQCSSSHFFRFFKFGAILPIYVHNSLSLSFSIQYTEQNQAILLHELHWQRTHVQISSGFYKVLQISLRSNMCYIF